jgi:tetratricopeptide (TPR) repeat protein
MNKIRIGSPKITKGLAVAEKHLFCPEMKLTGKIALLFCVLFLMQFLAGCSLRQVPQQAAQTDNTTQSSETPSITAQTGFQDDPFDLDAYEAEDVYNITLSLNPQGSPSLQKKAIQMRNQGNFTECLKLINQAIQMSPDMSSLYYSKGRTLLMMQRYQEAFESFQISIQKKPNAESYFFIGIIYAYLKNYDESNKALDESLKLKPNVYALYSKGISLDDQEDNDNALEYYNKALELNADFPAVWYSKGIVLCQLNRYDEAREAFKQALKLGSPRAQKALDTLDIKGL